MKNARLWLALAGETMFPPPTPFFLRAWGTSRFPTPLPPHWPTEVANEDERRGRDPPLARGGGSRGRLRPPGRRDPPAVRRLRARDDGAPRPRPPRAGRRAHGRGLRSRDRQGRCRDRHLRPRCDEPRHADRRRVDGLDAARLHHGPGAPASDRDGRVPGVRHHRHHDPDRQALVARPGRRRAAAGDEGGVPRRPHGPLRARPRRRPARRPGGRARLRVPRRGRPPRLEAAQARPPAADQGRRPGARRGREADALRRRRRAERERVRRAPRARRARAAAGRHDADGQERVPGDARAPLRLAGHARPQVVELGHEQVRRARRGRRALRRPGDGQARRVRSGRDGRPSRHRLRRDREAAPGRHPRRRAAEAGSRRPRRGAAPAARGRADAEDGAVAAPARRLARGVPAPVRVRWRHAEAAARARDAPAPHRRPAT